MLSASRLVRCSSASKKIVIFTGPSVKPKYDEALKKLNIGLAAHVLGGSMMLMSSSIVGASPLPAAVFAGLLWMQVMSTAKVTELGAWVNLCKNVIRIERIDHDMKSTDPGMGSKRKFVITTDGSKLSVETDTRDESDLTILPSFKQLKDLGILHIDLEALADSTIECKELFDRDDIVVTLNEGSKQLVQPPPGASKVEIPKLADIYQKREKVLKSDNNRINALLAKTRPMEPSKLIDRLGTASLAVGAAVFVLGGGMYVASESHTNHYSSIRTGDVKNSSV